MSSTVLFTIGFAGKSAEEFFNTLQKAGVKRVIDIRLNNTSQLAAFTKRGDLEYFLRTIAGIAYTHEQSLAPTKDILTAYKKKQIGWSQYESRFAELLQSRHPETQLTPEAFDHACLLCSEATPKQCHRRLVAEYLRDRWGNVAIEHL